VAASATHWQLELPITALAILARFSNLPVIIEVCVRTGAGRAFFNARPARGVFELLKRAPARTDGKLGIRRAWCRACRGQGNSRCLLEKCHRLQRYLAGCWRRHCCHGLLAWYACRRYAGLGAKTPVDAVTAPQLALSSDESPAVSTVLWHKQR